MTSKDMIAHAKAMDYAEEKEKSNEKRIHALELQVQTLTAAIQHLMQVTKPLILLAQQAEAQASGIILER